VMLECLLRSARPCARGARTAPPDCLSEVDNQRAKDQQQDVTTPTSPGRVMSQSRNFGSVGCGPAEDFPIVGTVGNARRANREQRESLVR